MMRKKVQRGNIKGVCFSSKGRGQAVVEFALVMTFFLLFMLALVDLGRAFYVSVALENAAAEGALYGAGSPTCVEPGSCGAEQDSIKWRVLNESPSGVLDPALITVDVSYTPTVPVAGGLIVVDVNYRYFPILPALSAFGASEIPLRRQAIQLIP